MSPEWMIAFDRQEATLRASKRHALADPLERAEWRGMHGVNTLLRRFAAIGVHPKKTSRQSVVSRWIFAFEEYRGR